MKRRAYEDPSADIVKFEAVDILTSSTEAFDGEWVPIGGNRTTDYSDYPVF